MDIVTINLGFVGLFSIAAVLLWFKTLSYHKKIDLSQVETDNEPDFVILSVQVPKNNDKTPQSAEQMFAALHGIFHDGAAAQISISFEIVAKNKVINFYIYCPRNLKEFVISQVFAQYPNVEIKEVENDYTEVQEDRAIAATELSLKRPAVYPIKTFQNFEVDPLSAITGVMSSVSSLEEIWIQVIIRPASDEWQEAGDKVIKEIREPSKHTNFMELAADEAKTFFIDFAKSVVTGQGGVAPEKKEDKKKDLGGPVEQAIKGIEEKTTKLGYETNIRILAAAHDEHVARAKLEQVVGAFKQFNTINLNSFVFENITSDKDALTLLKTRAFGEGKMIFNITELASLYHYPSETVATPTIAWAGSKKGEPPANLPLVGSVPADELTVFAQTNFRNEVMKFGIKKKDRRLHTYIIGKTGTGKSTLMENMIIDDISEGRGLAVVDPHGSLIQHVLDFIPESRIKDVVYFNPADHERPVGFNLLENVNPEQKNIVASGVVGILQKIFGEVSWGPRLEYILRNVILALLDYPNSTFLGIMRLLTDNAYRRLVMNEIKDPIIRDFFINEYEKYEPKFRTEAIAPIQNKVGQFLSSSTIRNIIGQPKSTIDMREIMDSGKILLADLSIGKIGEDNSALLGSMLITKIQLAAMGRVDMEENDRRDFYLYVDEFQNFATESFATILSEARKYRLNLAMANQYTAQMPESVANAVFGNVGTMVSFRVGAQDASMLVKEFEPIFDANDLVNLDNYQIYLKMAIDGVTVPAFSAGTLPPRTEHTGLTQQVIESSRQLYTRSVEEVEDYISEWSTPINLSEASSTAAAKQPYDSLAPRTESRGEEIKTIPKATQPEEGRVEPKTEVAAKEEGSRHVDADQVDEGSRQKEQAPTPENIPERVMKLPEGKKIQIIKDRFDRPWYAISESTGMPTIPSPSQSGGVAEETPIPHNDIQTLTQSGGEGQEEPLISWDTVEELGMLSTTDTTKTGQKPDPSNGIIPLEEIS